MERKDKLYFDFRAALAHLRQEEAALSPTALGALSGANRNELGTFAETWVNLPVERRRHAVQMLVDLAEENFEKDFNLLFRYMFTDEDAQVRARAIDGLWEDEDVSLVKPLVGFLRSDPNEDVRAVAADALGRFVLLAEYGRLTQDQLVELIHEALLATIRNTSESVLVRSRALEALAYWSQDVMRGVIAAAYLEEDARMRASAVSAMGRSADKYWRKTAAGELESPEPRMRFEAARAAGELEDRTAVPRLIELLEDSDREVQGAAITALGQVGGKSAREALLAAASSEDEATRSLADEALQELEFARGSDFLLLDMGTSENAAEPQADEVEPDDEPEDEFEDDEEYEDESEDEFDDELEEQDEDEADPDRDSMDEDDEPLE